jgi:hypothetical protein
MHPLRTLLRCALAAALTLLPVLPAAAQPGAMLLGAGERIVLDGRLDDPAWQRAPVHDRFVQFQPLDRLPPPNGYRTTLQVVAEADALVIGVRAFDPAPQEIRAPLTRRDQVRRDQDFIAVFVDAVGDRRAAQFVRVSAAGVLADGVYVAAGDSEDFAPDFDVDAAVQRLPDGYSVELRLPFIALRFPHEGGAPWRLMVARSVPRASNTLLLSAPLTKDGLSFIAEAPVVQGLESVAERARHQSLLWFKPELTLRATRERADGQPRRRDETASLGAELKWRPRADWVIDATLEPDFSQVELDAPQLAGNTRFALSVPEKRPFFLESTDVIDLPLAGFYSRSVTDPRYGLRATWRAPQADATGLSLRDEGGGLVLRPGAFGTAVYAQDGSSQATMLRARRHEGAVSAGVMLSERDFGAARGINRVAGADVYWTPGPQDQLRLRALQSRTTAAFDAQGQAQAGPAESGHWIEMRWNRRSADWIVNLDVDDISPRFRNDNGFVDQAGVRRVEGELIRRWGEAALPGFLAHEFETYVWTRHVATRPDAASGVEGGRTVATLWHPGVWFAGPRGSEGWVQLEIDAERVRPDGRLHATRGAGMQIALSPAPWMPRLAFEIKAGERVDVEADRVGRGVDGFVEANLRGSLGGLGLESEQKLQYARIERDGRFALDDLAARWLGVMHLSARDSLRAVWQLARYRRADDAALGIAQASDHQRTMSLVFQHRVGLGRSLAVGATRQRVEPGGQRRDELFVKAALAL